MKYKSGYQLISQEQFEIELPAVFTDLYVNVIEGMIDERKLTIFRGYPWDGASFPLFRFTGTPDFLKVPSMVHDFGYWLMNQSKMPLTFRIYWDQFFRKLVEERVCPRWPNWVRRPIAWVVGGVCYGIVRLFGNYCARHGRTVRDVQ